MSKQQLDPDRVQGALLGLAVGDALGTTLECRDLKTAPFPELIKGPVTHPTGGGPYEVAPGEVTDDTHMACCLAASLQEWGFFAPNFVVDAYVNWVDFAFDIGRQTRAALNVYAGGLGPVDAAFHVWERSGFQAAGNGSLMRTAPIGIFYAQDPVARRNASIMDSSLTHADPRCSLACAAFNTAIAKGVAGAESPKDLWEAASEELPLAANHLKQIIPDMAPQHIRSMPSEFWESWGSRVDQAESNLRSDLDHAVQSIPSLDSKEVHLQEHQGFVRVAFRLAFWQLLHRASFSEALLDTINRGGDADTNGAIIGAMLGSFFGRGAIPRDWSETVLTCIPRRMDLERSEYHPRTLMKFAMGLEG